MPRPILAVLLSAVAAVVALGGLGCRQLAGIEDIEPGDAGGEAGDAGDGGRREAGREGGGPCVCTGCTELASGLNAPLSVILVGTDLYVLSYGPGTGQGSLVKVPASGGTAQTVEGSRTRPLGITADATHLYWMEEADGGSGTVVKRAFTGGPVTTLATGVSVPVGLVSGGFVGAPTNTWLALSPTDVYFLGFAGGQPAGVLSVPIAGGTVSTFLAGSEPEGGATMGPVFPYGLVTDGTSLFILDGNGVFAGILAAPLAGGPPTVVVDNLAFPANFALAGSEIYLLDDGVGVGSQGTVQAVKSAGGTAKVLAMGQPVPWAILVDTGELYWADEGVSGFRPGSLRKASLDGGAPVTLAHGLFAPEALAIDSKFIYWVDSTCGSVLKLPR